MDKCTARITRKGVTEAFSINEELCDAILLLINDADVSNIILDLISHTKKSILPLMEDNPQHILWEEDWDEDDF